MNEVFDLIYKFLKWISKISGFTYREVNIIVYFIIIPSLFFFLLSKIYNKATIITGFLIFVFLGIIIIPDFEHFSNLLFDKSVVFLNWFNIIGLNYVQASVVICVILPILIIFLLIYLKNKRKNETNNIITPRGIRQ